jgi:hypothetical protein
MEHVLKVYLRSRLLLLHRRRVVGLVMIARVDKGQRARLLRLARHIGPVMELALRSRRR